VRSDASDYDSHAFGVHTGGTYKLSVRCDGKIGIGTHAPQNQLTIKGSSTSDYDVMRTSLGGSNENLYYTLWRASGGFMVVRAKGTGGDLNIGINTPEGDAFEAGGGNITFKTNQSGSYGPCMRMWTNGRLYHGRDVINDGNNGAGEILTGGGAIILHNHTSAAGSSLFQVKTGSTKTLRMQIKCDGDLENNNNSYAGISDIKLKENIIDVNSQWDDIKSLQVRNYNFKSETGYQDHKQIGLIAQEVEKICPGLVGETVDEQTDETTKSVKYSILYMKAVKALQEAMQRIESLEQRLDTLENN